MSITGPGITRQAELARALKRAPALAVAMVDVASASALSSYGDGFGSGRDPYGAAWAPSPNGLHVTGNLANPTLTVTDKGFRISTAKHGYPLHFGWHPGHNRKSLLKESRSLLGQARPGKGSTSAERKAYRSNLSFVVRSLRAALTAGGAAVVPPRRIIPDGPGSRWDAPILAAITKVAYSHLRGRGAS